MLGDIRQPQLVRGWGVDLLWRMPLWESTMVHRSSCTTGPWPTVPAPFLTEHAPPAILKGDLARGPITHDHACNSGLRQPTTRTRTPDHPGKRQTRHPPATPGHTSHP